MYCNRRLRLKWEVYQRQLCAAAKGGFYSFVLKNLSEITRVLRSKSCQALTKPSRVTHSQMTLFFRRRRYDAKCVVYSVIVAFLLPIVLAQTTKPFVLGLRRGRSSTARLRVSELSINRRIIRVCKTHGLVSLSFSRHTSAINMSRDDDLKNDLSPVPPLRTRTGFRYFCKISVAQNPNSS